MRDGIDLGAIRVLVVDDESDARDVMKIFLEGCGAQVDTSASARQALQQLTDTTYDVIVSDLSMPEMSGYEFIRELRARGVSTPALAVTAYSRSEYGPLISHAGFNMQLAKPLVLDDFLRAVARLAKNEASEDGKPPPEAQP